jgi:hypothetical protein
MSLDDFKAYNRANHRYYPSDPGFKAELPSPDTIYYKDFHFLEEPLINKKYPPRESGYYSSKIEESKYSSSVGGHFQPTIVNGYAPKVTLVDKGGLPMASSSSI